MKTHLWQIFDSAHSHGRRKDNFVNEILGQRETNNNGLKARLQKGNLGDGEYRRDKRQKRNRLFKAKAINRLHKEGSKTCHERKDSRTN